MKKIVKSGIAMATIMLGTVMLTQSASADYFDNARTPYGNTPAKSRGYWKATKAKKIGGGSMRYFVKISKSTMTARYMVHQFYMGESHNMQDHPIAKITDFGWGKAGHKQYWAGGLKHNPVTSKYDYVPMKFTFTGKGYKHVTIRLKKTKDYPKTMHLKKISKTAYQKGIRE